MRILITGITGQVGGALVARLQDFETIIPANRSVINLAEPDSIAERLDALAPDLIVNSAAYTAVDRAEDETAIAMLVNGIAPGVIADWAAQRQVPLIHFSTDYIFNGKGARPWREEDPPEPLSIYGTSKLAGEDNIRQAGGRHLIIRTSWVYAARGTNFLRTIARLSAERTELRIVNDQVGAPTSAAMIAEATARMIEGGVDSLRLQMEQTDGCVHVAASGEASWYQFAESIVTGLKARGVKLATQRLIAISSGDYPTKALRPNNSRLDLSRLTGVFGITMPHWDVGLARELDILTRQLNTSSAGPR